MAGGQSSNIKMGRFLAWAPPSKLDTSILAMALLVLLGESLPCFFVFSVIFVFFLFFGSYLCYVIKELAKKKISHP